MRWIYAIAVGSVLAILGLFLVFNPLGILAQFCIEEPCTLDRLLGGVVLVVGIALIITGGVWYRKRGEIETVTIALGDEAEQEAVVLEQLQTAVRRHMNPDDLLPQQEPKKKVDERNFITLPKDERKIRKVHKR